MFLRTLAMTYVLGVLMIACGADECKVPAETSCLDASDSELRSCTTAKSGVYGA